MRRLVLIGTMLAVANATGAVHSQRADYNARLDEVLTLCAELALAHPNQDEVQFWLGRRRGDLSQTFWSKEGVTFLRSKLRSSGAADSACINQLLREAHVGRIGA